MNPAIISIIISVAIMSPVLLYPIVVLWRLLRITTPWSDDAENERQAQCQATPLTTISVIDCQSDFLQLM